MDTNNDSLATDENGSVTHIPTDDFKSALADVRTSTEPASIAPIVTVDQNVLLPPSRKEISRLLIQDWDEDPEHDEASPVDNSSKITVSEVGDIKVNNEVASSSAVCEILEPTKDIDLLSSSSPTDSQETSNNIGLSSESAPTEIKETKSDIEIYPKDVVSDIQETKDNIKKSSDSTILLDIQNAESTNNELSNSAVSLVVTKNDNISMLCVPAAQETCDDVKDVLQSEDNNKTVIGSSKSDIVNTFENGQSIPESNPMIVPKKEYTQREETSHEASKSSVPDSNVGETDKKIPLGMIHNVLSEDVKTTEDIVIVSVMNMPDVSDIKQSLPSKLEDINVINLTDDSSQSDWDKALGILEDTKSSINHTELTTSASVNTQHTDNNNSLTNQLKAALDRKQLLDILEGNEDTSSKNLANLITPKIEHPVAVSKRAKGIKVQMDAIDEHKIALKQLTALPRQKKSSVNSPRKKVTNAHPSPTVKEHSNKKYQPIRTYSKVDSNKVVQTLVDDWEIVEIPTEPPTENDISNNANEERAVSVESLPDEYVGSEQTLPPRRMSRIIKKKVIFDPDNPDSFPSTSTVGTKPSTQDQVSNEIQKDVQKEKTNSLTKKRTIQPPSKGVKSKLKSVTKWAKPQMKAKFKAKKKISKDLKKRKSEVDRLLMDEGAVNMIYQLELSNNNADVPVPKHSKKNIKSRAAIIKKAVINQSNSQNSATKIKIFRIRNVDKRGEEQKPKKVKSKTKCNLRESMKSPSPCDEFITDADASIIVRRHSSSSYTSSTCLSPRRLSDVETVSSEQTSNRAGQPYKTKHTKGPAGSHKDVFLSVLQKDGLDRKDCLSLKEKLNSKLSNVLNFKRKSESNLNSQLPGKNQKVRKEIPTSSSESIFTNLQVPGKHQKVLKKNDTQIRKDTVSVATESTFSQLAMECESKIMHITIKKSATGDMNLYNLQTLQELQFALHTANESSEANITLLTSEDGTLCGGLDLSGVLSTRHEKRLKAATEMADSVRSLLLAMESHKNLLCVSVSGHCVGLGLAMLVLCDLAVASRDSTFCLYAAPPSSSLALPAPGMSVLMTHTRALHSTTCSELLLCGTKLNSNRARQVKLVTRLLPQDDFKADLQGLLAPLAAQSAASLTLNKQLLRLAPVNSILRASVDRERDVLLQYWLSAAGQVAIRDINAVRDT